VRPHPRENREVRVHALNPEGEQDADLWAQVIAVQAKEPPSGTGGDYHLRYLRDRQAGQRELFRAGRGAWFVALEGDRVVASLGIVVTAGRARYQHVDTVESHRRRGIASRLVVEAARLSSEAHQIDHFVIAADPAYHALGLYRSVGFEPVEAVSALQLNPPDAGD
jgi:GNAT superfamily N-acetyltransferase